MRVSAIAILLLIAAQSLVASAQDIAHTLSHKYSKRVLILRHPIKDNSQSYNVAGDLVSHSEEGPWTVYGPVEITKVQFKGTQLRVNGYRLVFGYDSTRKELVPYREKHPDTVHVEIELASQSMNLDQADAVINRIFADSDEKILPLLPDYWRPYFEKRMHHEIARTPSSASTTATNQSANSNQQVLKVMHVGEDGVTAPKALSTPEPEFSEIARRLRRQGICVISAIIDREGRVRQPYIVRPAGVGLDEQAIATVKTWKFKPATRYGQPVDVEMGLEVLFNLY